MSRLAALNVRQIPYTSVPSVAAQQGHSLQAARGLGWKLADGLGCEAHCQFSDSGLAETKPVSF
jgi:hypothetical protein